MSVTFSGLTMYLTALLLARRNLVCKVKSSKVNEAWCYRSRQEGCITHVASVTAFDPAGYHQGTIDVLKTKPFPRRKSRCGPNRTRPMSAKGCGGP